jgi:hypothetical protein
MRSIAHYLRRRFEVLMQCDAPCGLGLCQITNRLPDRNYPSLALQQIGVKLDRRELISLLAALVWNQYQTRIVRLDHVEWLRCG